MAIANSSNPNLARSISEAAMSGGGLSSEGARGNETGKPPTSGEPRPGRALTSEGNWGEAGLGEPDPHRMSMNPPKLIELNREGSRSGEPVTQPLNVDYVSTGERRTIGVCDTQPVTAEGVRTLLTNSPDLQFARSFSSLSQAAEALRNAPPDVLIVDKAFGIQAILEWMADLRGSGQNDPLSAVGIVIWGVSISEAEALRFLQSGARGILRKTADVSVVMACLRTVAAGRSWMEDSVFRDGGRAERYPRSELTAREQQVLELVEQGFKNRDIAHELGIRPGTVKIHLKHIFEKTGVRGRYGLALNGLRQRGVVSVRA
jgi:two-component system nitrate/nitrite response regulator NarL